MKWAPWMHANFGPAAKYQFINFKFQNLAETRSSIDTIIFWSMLHDHLPHCMDAWKLVCMLWITRFIMTLFHFEINFQSCWHSSIISLLLYIVLRLCLWYHHHRQFSHFNLFHVSISIATTSNDRELYELHQFGAMIINHLWCFVWFSGCHLKSFHELKCESAKPYNETFFLPSTGSMKKLKHIYIILHRIIELRKIAEYLCSICYFNFQFLFDLLF